MPAVSGCAKPKLNPKANPNTNPNRDSKPKPNPNPNQVSGCAKQDYAVLFVVGVEA